MVNENVAPNAQAAGNTRNDVDGEDMSTDLGDLGEITQTLQRSAHGLSTEIRRESQRLMHDATESATALASEKKSVAAEYLRAVSEAAGASRQVLEDRGYAGTSRFLTHAVESLDELTENLSSREPTELLDDAISYARRNPAIFLGAALFAGFGLTRLVQSSADAEEIADDEDLYDDDEMDEDVEMDDTAEGETYES